MCMRLKPEAEQDSPTLWSIPVGIDTSEGGLRHVPVPVKAPQQPQGSYRPGEEAGPSYRRRIETMLTAAGPAWQLEGPRVARQIKHLSLCVTLARRLAQARHEHSLLLFAKAAEACDCKVEVNGVLISEQNSAKEHS